MRPLYDLDLVDLVVESGSAKSLDREGLQNVLGRLQSGEANGIIVTKLDRLTRSVADLGKLVETYFQEHALLSVSEQIDTRSAAGRLVLNVLASVSQWETGSDWRTHQCRHATPETAEQVYRRQCSVWFPPG